MSHEKILPLTALLSLFLIIIMYFVPIDMQSKLWFELGVLSVLCIARVIYEIQEIHKQEDPALLTREEFMKIVEQLETKINSLQAQIGR